MSTIPQGTDAEQGEFWRLVFEAHQASGLKVKLFCRREGLTEWSFYHWRKKLGLSARRKTGGESIPRVKEIDRVASSIAEKTMPRGGEFMEVPLPMVHSGGATGQLRFASGCVLQFDAGISRGSLMNILSSLRELGLC